MQYAEAFELRYKAPPEVQTLDSSLRATCRSIYPPHKMRVQPEITLFKKGVFILLASFRFHFCHPFLGLSNF